MNSETLNREGMKPKRFGWLVRPLRRLVFRLLRPYFDAFLAEQGRLEHTIHGTSVRVAALARPPADADLAARIDRLDASVETLSRVAGQSGGALSDSVSQELAMIKEELGRLEQRTMALELKHESIEARTSSIAALEWDR
jgi:hypothetical protein